MELLTITRVEIYGAVLLLAGIAMRYWVNRRKFNRTIGYRLEQFASYEQYKAYSFVEKKIRQLGMLLILAGLFLIGCELFNQYSAGKHRQEKEQYLRQMQHKDH